MKKLVKLSFLLIAASVLMAASPRAELIGSRVEKIGQVTVSGQAAEVATAAAKSSKKATGGEAIYQQFCHTCHAMGLAGAPKLGDKAAWSPRVKQGKETLYKHAIKGYNAMPAMGTCMQCTEDQIKETVDYMLGKL